MNDNLNCNEALECPSCLGLRVPIYGCGQPFRDHCDKLCEPCLEDYGERNRTLARRASLENWSNRVRNEFETRVKVIESKLKLRQGIKKQRVEEAVPLPCKEEPKQEEHPKTVPKLFREDIANSTWTEWLTKKGQTLNQVPGYESPSDGDGEESEE